MVARRADPWILQVCKIVFQSFDKLTRYPIDGRHLLRDREVRSVLAQDHISLPPKIPNIRHLRQ